MGIDAQGPGVDVAILPGAHAEAVAPARGDDAQVVDAAAGEGDLVAPSRGLSRSERHHCAAAPRHDGAARGQRAQELDERDGRARRDGDLHGDALALEQALARHLMADPMVEGGGGERERYQGEQQREGGDRCTR